MSALWKEVNLGHPEERDMEIVEGRETQLMAQRRELGMDRINRPRHGQGLGTLNKTQAFKSVIL